ncbi:MAG: hypothetical protein FD174_4269, partial [Geobacteraceae bacterium]
SYGSFEGGIEGLSSEFTRVEEALAPLYARWEELEIKKAGTGDQGPEMS